MHSLLLPLKLENYLLQYSMDLATNVSIQECTILPENWALEQEITLTVLKLEMALKLLSLKISHSRLNLLVMPFWLILISKGISMSWDCHKALFWQDTSSNDAQLLVKFTNGFRSVVQTWVFPKFQVATQIPRCVTRLIKWLIAWFITNNPKTILDLLDISETIFPKRLITLTFKTQYFYQT